MHIGNAPHTSVAVITVITAVNCTITVPQFCCYIIFPSAQTPMQLNWSALSQYLLLRYSILSTDAINPFCGRFSQAQVWGCTGEVTKPSVSVVLNTHWKSESPGELKAKQHQKQTNKWNQKTMAGALQYRFWFNGSQAPVFLKVPQVTVMHSWEPLLNVGKISTSIPSGGKEKSLYFL